MAAVEAAFDDALEGVIADPQERSEVVQRVQRVALTFAQFRSPYPPTEYLRDLDRIVPGGAAHVMAQADAQGEHRRHLERTVVEGGSRRADRGQWMGLSIALVFLASAVILVLMGHDVAGVILGSVDLVALVAVFVVGKGQQERGVQNRRDG